MENIWLFVLTVVAYSLVWFIIVEHSWKPRYILLTHWVKRVAVVALLVLPLNINGNVFTIAGNATAEKNVYSILSFYQRAEQDAVILFGLAGYQKAGQDAETLIGLAGYQQAGRDAVTDVGLAGYQKAGRNAATLFGLAGYQSAGQKAMADITIALYQRVGEKTRAFGAFSTLTKD